MILPLLVACAGTAVSTDGETSPLGPAVVSDPQIASFADAPLARLLTVEGDEASALEVHLTSAGAGTRLRWPEVALRHEVPLLGLAPDRTWTAEVWLIGPRGDTLAGTLEIPVGPLPLDFPDVEVVAHDPERVEPGFLLANVHPLGSHPHWLVVWDKQSLDVVWYLARDESFGDVGRTAEGTLLGLAGDPEVPQEIDFLGRTQVRWTPEPSAPEDVLLPIPNAHHEVHPDEEGTLWTLARETILSDAYPQDYGIDAPTAPAFVLSGEVVRMDRGGTLLSQWPLADLFDPQRVSFDGLTLRGQAYDWLHVNGAVPHPDGGVVVSLRNQDALARLDDAGRLVWLLGDPAGWGLDHLPFLLEEAPGAAFDWPYHQHAPAWTGDGLLVVFDNHNNGHTPYTEAPAEPWRSRVVAYRIDEVAGTVSQAWDFVPTGEPLQSIKMGDADPLPETGHVLANFGYILDGVEFEPGTTSMRLVEFDPTTQATVLDLWLHGQVVAETDGGVRSYRSESIPQLYPDDVVVEALP